MAIIQDIPPPVWVDTAEGMMKVVDHIYQTGECALDTETTGLSRWKDHVVVWSLCPDIGTRYCLSREMLHIYEMELAHNCDINWYFTNQTFDFCMLANSGVSPPDGPSFCTLAMDWLNDENRQGRHGLKETGSEYCHIKMTDFKENFPKKRGETLPEAFIRTLDEDFEAAVDYASKDAWATFRVFKSLRSKLRKQFNSKGESLWNYFVEIEMPYTRVLYNMIHRGIKINKSYLQELAPRMKKDIERIERQITRIAEKEVNLNSTPQLRWLLYEKLGLEPFKKTKGGTTGIKHPATDAEVLEKFAEDGVEACRLILENRKLTKSLGTYVEGLPKHADKRGRIHPTLNQHVTVTGRLSSTEPNLQNIPRTEGDIYGLRNAFIPANGYVFCVFDYAQLEIRILAHMSREKNMIDVINKGWDVHTGTASLMFGHSYEDIVAAAKKKKKIAAAKDKQKEGKPLTPEEQIFLTMVLTELEKEMIFARQASKTIGFGLLYGEGVKKLAHTLGVSVDRAKELLEMFFAPYPRVRDYIERCHRMAHVDHYIETVVGRPRRFPTMAAVGHLQWHQLTGQMRGEIAKMERQATNSSIQGSAADVARRAQLKCEFDPRLRDLGCRMLLQIHDELIFEVPEDNAEEAMPIIKDLMEHPLPFDLAVPLTVEGGIGKSWAQAKG
jgi:DNA polymerase I